MADAYILKFFLNDSFKVILGFFAFLHYKIHVQIYCIGKLSKMQILILIAVLLLYSQVTWDPPNGPVGGPNRLYVY